MKRLPPKQTNSRVHRERDFRALSKLAVLLFMGVALTAGFIFAARQHFVAVNYGYKNEELRRERQRLLVEQRQLSLAREEALSPAVLEPAARQLGLQPIAPGQVSVRPEVKPVQSRPATVIQPLPSIRQ
jgi:hypothetical protein